MKSGPTIIMVMFEPAVVDLASNYRAFYKKMQKHQLVPNDMSVDEFEHSALFRKLRGHYVYHRVNKRHQNTRRSLLGVISEKSILGSIAISNVFIIKATASIFEHIRVHPEVLEINTIETFAVKLESSAVRKKTATRTTKEGAGIESKRASSKAVAMQAMRVFKLSQSLAEEPEIQWNVYRIGAADVWERYRRFGEGIVVGVADSGAFFEHPGISQNYRGRADGAITGLNHNYSWWDGVRQKIPYTLPSRCTLASDAPCDDRGHGSHCISTAVGKDGLGIAPGAKWIACRNMEQGFGTTVTYLNCLNFFLAPHDLEVSSCFE